MESRVLRILVSLGVPGVALGVFYLLLNRFNWTFPSVPEPWVGPIVVLFMILAAMITFYALNLWSPHHRVVDPKDQQRPRRSSESALELEFRSEPPFVCYTDANRQYNVAVRNISEATVEDVEVKVTAIRGAPAEVRGQLPATLYRIDEHIDKTSRFVLHPGEQELLNVVSGTDGLDHFEVLHIVRPEGFVIQLPFDEYEFEISAFGRNIMPAHPRWFRVGSGGATDQVLRFEPIKHQSSTRKGGVT